ncbi:hypothetical protein KDW_30240 [Dictyobacter vulcani]|uniref:Uncharacterized protein n=2 Tax=Dictyobacter vulcani TaxID=2607529 RepID=A0A5J4KNY1_9CHLR|nr:hypothetical protein KDW_30240 [Dictyobacter vulcani]
MRWDITVKSIDGSNSYYSINKFSLHCSCDEDNPDKIFEGTGKLISAIGYAGNMQDGTEASQVFFGFIPYQKPISYQLTAEIYCNDINAPSTYITFDPLTLTL